MLIGKPALHRDHPAGIGVHRHEPTLNVGDLAQGPVLKFFRVILGRAFGRAKDFLDVNHVADRQQIAGFLGGFAGLAVFAHWFGPFHVFHWNAVPTFDFDLVFNADPGGKVGQFQHHGQMPAINVARQNRTIKGRAPGGFIDQVFGFQLQNRAAKDALLAVIFFKPVAQSLGGNLLQMRVHRGANGHAAAKKLVLAERV